MALAAVATRPTRQTTPRGSVQWAVNNFLLDARARNLTPETIDFYGRKLRPLTAYMEEQGVEHVESLTRTDLTGYLVSLQDAGKSGSNVYTHASAARAFIGWLAENDMLDATIARRFKMPRKGKPERAVFTRQELTSLLEAAGKTAQPERDVAILSVMLDCGLRGGEVGRTRDDDVDLNRILIHGKGRKERWVPISPTTRKAVQKWIKRRGESEWLFITVRNEPMDRQTVYKLFRRLGEVTGIDPCYPHMMRRAVATSWIREGGDTFTLQSLLGHSSQTMSRIYVQMADETVQEKHAKLSLVEKIRRGGRG